MIWGKRRFQWAEYSPYFDRMEKLITSSGALYPQFIMVSVKTDKPSDSDIYVGVPSEPFMAMFDGFERVEESALPKVVDTLLIADATTDEFKNRFEFKRGRR